MIYVGLMWIIILIIITDMKKGKGKRYALQKATDLLSQKYMNISNICSIITLFSDK